MEARDIKISDILNRMKLLEIPYYQRAYVWKEAQWERFLEDMKRVSDTGEPYFMGSFILKQCMTSSSNKIGDVRIVIDGQQRLTTLTIFFKVLSLALNKKGIFNTFLISEDEDEEEKMLAIKHNRIDKGDFEMICALDSLIEIQGESQIIKLYQFFYKNIEIIKTIDSPTLKNNLLFVCVDLKEKENEQQIFDTINSLGVKLNSSELLKNYFFDRNNFADYEKYWEAVFEKTTEDKKYWDQEIVVSSYNRHLIDLFFYAFLVIKIHEIDNLSTEDKLGFLRMEDLFESYKKLINNYLNGEKQRLIEEISRYAKIFKDNINPDCLKSSIPASPCIDRINVLMFGLDNTTLLPYILFLISNNEIAEDEKNAIYEKLEAYLMRRIICRSETRSYNRMFYDSIFTNRVISASDFVSFVSDRKEACPTDQEISDAVHHSCLTNARNTGILYMLESRLRTGENFATSLNGLNSYSLEHLMPKKWERTWKTAPMTAEEIEFRNHILLTLGNLAIIPGKLNTAISNADWQTKLNGKGNRDGLKKCAGGLVTMSEVITKTSWSETDIQSRAAKLVEQMKSVWSF